MQRTPWNLFFAGIVYLTAAWFGVGYHAEDEFQHVILVAEHLRGHVSVDALPLDFDARWRSALLPLTAAGIFAAGEALGIDDPFILTFLLRLFTAAFALWTMDRLARATTIPLRRENRSAYAVLSWFLWFVPVLQIRFTSEAWGGLLFAQGLAVLLNGKPRNAWFIGAWWGLAVLCRPAAAILPLSALIWALVVKRIEVLRLIRIAGGASCAVLVGLLIDRAVYGELTITLWNYVRDALLGEESARFTPLPWYHYALFAVKYATPPVALLLVLSYATLLALNWRHPLVWLVGGFLIAHSVLPIKELRFLFPIAPLMPWLLISAWDKLCERWQQRMGEVLWLRLLFPFAALNALALAVGMLTPAGNGRVRLAAVLHDRFGDAPVHVDQLGDWRQWIPPFYLTAGSTEDFVEKVVATKERPVHVVIAKQSRGMERVKNLERMAYATPPWTHRFLRWYGLEDGYDPLVLYRLESGVIGH